MARIHTTILVSCTALLPAVSGIVVAQETVTASVPAETTTVMVPTTVSKSSNETTCYGNVVGDHTTRIVSAEHIDETAAFVLESDLSRTTIVITPVGSISTGVVIGNPVRRPTPPGRTAIQIDSPESWATLVMPCSVENGRCIEIRSDDGDSMLITDPFTGVDVRDVAIGGALGAPLGALLIIVRRRFGLHRDMEYVT